jgi:hypothetical protein
MASSAIGHFADLAAKTFRLASAEFSIVSNRRMPFGVSGQNCASVSDLCRPTQISPSLGRNGGCISIKLSTSAMPRSSCGSFPWRYS